MKNIVDSHQHFWQLSRGDYNWLTPELSTLYRDFMPVDLQPLLHENFVIQTVLVQAAPSLAETEFLLRLSDEHDFIAKVVGFVDLLTEEAVNQIEKLKQHAKFTGIRPMLQDIPAVDWILKTNLDLPLRALSRLNLTFDALILPEHITTIARLADKFPDLKIVVDHGAKPKINNQQWQPWAKDIFDLGQRENVYCKLSGLVTEGNADSDFHAYFDHLLQAFTTKKIMWGSDWPVLNLANNYQGWLSMAKQFCLQLSESEQICIFKTNCQNFYNF